MYPLMSAGNVVPVAEAAAVVTQMRYVTADADVLQIEMVLTTAEVVVQVYKFSGVESDALEMIEFNLL
jgi:hypothetical protein